LRIETTINNSTLKLLRYKSAQEELIWLIIEVLLEKDKQDPINPSAQEKAPRR
jgi:hypothetical protein